MTDRATAWDRLLDLIDETKAADSGTSPFTAIADAIRVGRIDRHSEED